MFNNRGCSKNWRKSLVLVFLFASFPVYRSPPIFIKKLSHTIAKPGFKMTKPSTGAGLTVESVKKAQHDDPHPPLPPASATYLEVRDYLWSLLTARPQGLAEACPNTIIKFIHAWYKPGLVLASITQEDIQNLAKKDVQWDIKVNVGGSEKNASRAIGYVVFDAIYQARSSEPSRYERKRAELKGKRKELEDEMQHRDVYEREKEEFETMYKQYRQTHPKHKNLRKLKESLEKQTTRLERKMKVPLEAVGVSSETFDMRI